MRYTTADIASELKVSERTVRRWIADLIDYTGGKYTVSEDVLFLLKNRATSDSLRTRPGQSSDSENESSDELIAEWFTEEEHELFMKVIYTEYPVMKKQIEMSNENLNLQKDYIKTLEKQLEYFQFSYNKQLEVHEELIESFRERNFIEAKEKGLDKP